MAEAPAAPPAFTRRIHILPVSVDTTAVDGQADSVARMAAVAPELEKLRASGSLIRTGQYVRPPEHEFVVVKVEPEGSRLGSDTVFYFDGDPIARLEKVQFLCLWHFESSADRPDASTLFEEHISPHFSNRARRVDGIAHILRDNEHFDVVDLHFQVAATDPNVQIGIMDDSTMVYVDWDKTPEFRKIHIVPFADTLPQAYSFNVFEDYLRPFLRRHRYLCLSANDRFCYHGVQFKVACCLPSGPARIGRDTTIYCEGAVDPSLRDLLPGEIVDRLSTLPEPLQTLIMSTEALLTGYEDRLVSFHDAVRGHRGLRPESLERIGEVTWGDDSDDLGSSTQCMVCLCEFVAGDRVRRLPCNGGHRFHRSCIDEWLSRCTDCPICKCNVEMAILSTY